MPSDAPATPPVHDTDLGRLFGTVWVGTVLFNVVVLLPVFLLVILVAPGTPVVSANWMPDEAMQSRLGALFFLPIMASISGVLMGLQNAVVVCSGLLASRWVSRAKERLVGPAAPNNVRTN